MIRARSQCLRGLAGMEGQNEQARKVLYKYIRFSSLDQAKGSSFQRQNERIMKFAQDNGFEINDDFKLEDLGKSGFHGINTEIDQGLGRFISAIDKGLIPTDGSAYLAIEQIDRLGRQKIIKAQELFNSILSRNVNIITLMDNKVYTKKSLENLMEIVYSLILMEQAHQESLKKSERIKSAYNSKLKKIKEIEAEQKKNPDDVEPIINKVQFSGVIPAWLDKKTEIIKGKAFTTYEVNPEKKALIEKIVSMISEENGYFKVAKTLNEQNIPLIPLNRKSERTTQWTSASVANFITNDAIYGDLVLFENGYEDREIDYEGVKATKKVKVRSEIDRVKNYYPAVISKAKIMGVRARANGKRLGRVAGRRTTDNLFQNLVFCGDCGDALHLHKAVQKRSYGNYYRTFLACYSKKNHQCDSVFFPYQDFENEIIKRIILPINESKLTNTTKAVDERRKEEMLKLESEIKDIEDRIAEFTYEMKNNRNVKASIALSVISELENDKAVKIEKINKHQSETDKLLEALEVGANIRNFDLETEAGREGFKIALKQKYAGFILYTKDQFCFYLEKTGAASSLTIPRTVKKGKPPKPNGRFKGGIFDSFKFMKEQAEIYKEGKLYNLINTWRNTHIIVQNKRLEDDERGKPLEPHQ